jgi:DNA-binding CsgD family transcriptional regulator
MAKSKTTDGELAIVVEKLDQILRVIALQAAAEKSVTEGARMLKLAGMDNQTIAEVLNTSPATVRTLTSNLHMRR